MISLTPSAVEHLRNLLREKEAPDSAGLRLAVERGGCAGLQYLMKIDEPAQGDQMFEQDGVRLIVGSDSIQYLDESQVDYLDGLNDSGFRVVNPNASRSCGCGTSFEPKTAGERAEQ